MSSIYRTPEGKDEIIKRYEEILKYWPIPCDMITVPTSFGDTFVVASGAKTDKAVILLHGSSSNSAIWMGDVATLGSKRRVFAIDIIGEPGKSAESRPGGYMNYGKWLTEVLDGLGVGKTAVVGNSLGGWMALSLASYAPERVESLVLLASGGLSPLRFSFLLKTVMYYKMGIKGEAKSGRMLYGDMQMPEEVLEFARLIGENYIPRVKGYGAHPDSVFKNITMPVLYIAGSDDSLLPTKKNAARLKRLVPQAQIKVLKGAPHVLFGLADDIAAFIDSEKTEK